MQRRTVLMWLISTGAAWPLRGIRLHAQAMALSSDGLALLRALAPAVLPSELGAPGHDKVAGDFVAWLASYQSGAERSWGYGHPRRTVTPTITIGTYETQLRALDGEARRRGAPFADQPVDTRRAIVSTTLETLKVQNFPRTPNGGHVITDLMSFFFGSGPANDLAYRANIGRATCRGLAGAERRPVS